MTVASAAKPNLEDVMKELRAGYRKLKGNERATNEEIADYLYSAFRLATLSHEIDKTDDTFEGFYIKGDEAARYTTQAIDRLRQTLFENEIPRRFQMTECNEAKTFRITLTGGLSSEQQHQQVNKKLLDAIGASKTNRKHLANPTPHDPAQKQRTVSDVVYHSTILQCANLVSNAPMDDEGNITLGPAQAILLFQVFERIYPRSSKNAEFSSLLPEKRDRNLLQPRTLNSDAAMRFLSNVERAGADSTQYGERYFLARLNALADRDLVPVNNQYDIVRDYLFAMLGVHLADHTLHIHDSKPDDIEPWLRRFVGPSVTPDDVTYDAQEKSFTLSDTAVEAYKREATRIHSQLMRGERMEVVKHLRKLEKDANKPAAVALIASRPSATVAEVVPTGRAEGTVSQEPAPSTAAAAVMEDTKTKELAEFMAGFADMDAATQIWNDVRKPGNFRAGNSSYVLANLTAEKAGQIAELLQALAGNASAHITIKPHKSGNDITVAADASDAIAAKLTELLEYKDAALHAWQLDDRNEAADYKNLALESFNSTVPETLRLSLPRVGGKAVSA